jgi:hypothetical protein
MINDVKIYDNILNEEEKYLLENYCKNNKHLFKYIKNIAYETDENLPGWVLHQSNIDTEINEIIEKLQLNVCKKINLEFVKNYRYKINLTKPINLTEEEEKKLIHKDRNVEHVSLIYYINEANGDTIIYKNNEILKIIPKKGRAVVFDGKFEHYGKYPNIGERYIININFVANTKLKSKLL